MTAAEWFAATDPHPLLRAARSEPGPQAGSVSGPPQPPPGYTRRRRLFAVACARQVWHLLPTDARSAVLVSERLADGRATLTDVRAAAVAVPNLLVTPAQNAIAAAAHASAVARPVYFAGDETPPPEPSFAAHHAARALACEAVGPAPRGPSAPESWHRAWNRVYAEARAMQAAFARDIFPPPGYSPALRRGWLTDAVRALARQVDETGDYSSLPILADALQDAGCEDDALLQCCRTPGAVHVRGNWVVDLLLGRG